MKESFQPPQSTEFWCSDCDCEVVKASDPDTGHFFIQAGHSYSARSKEYDGAYMMVMFALCKQCEKRMQ